MWSPHSEKTVTLPRHPFPALPHPTPHTSYTLSTPAQFPLTNPARSRNFAIALEVCAHPCYPRSHEGPTPRPRKPRFHTAKSPGIGSGVPFWAPCGSDDTATNLRRAPCPPLSRGAPFVLQKYRAGITDWRRIVGAPSYEAHRMSQKRTEFASPPPREQRPGALCNLKQALAVACC